MGWVQMDGGFHDGCMFHGLTVSLTYWGGGGWRIENETTLDTRRLHSCVRVYHSAMLKLSHPSAQERENLQRPSKIVQWRQTV